jgi:hypothetical protein
LYEGEYLRSDVLFVHKGDCSFKTEDTMPSWITLTSYLEHHVDGPDADAREAERGELERALAEAKESLGTPIYDYDRKWREKQPRKSPVISDKFTDCCAGEWHKYPEIPSGSESVFYCLVRMAYKYDCDHDLMRVAFEKTMMCEQWSDKWPRLGEQEIERAAKWAEEHPGEQNAERYARSKAGAPQQQAAPRVLNVIRFSALKPEPIRWMWKGYLAARKLTMLNGEPATEKALSVWMWQRG